MISLQIKEQPVPNTSDPQLLLKYLVSAKVANDDDDALPHVHNHEL